MTWTNAPQPGGGEPRWESPEERRARETWQRGGTTLFPAGRMADRIVTILLLAFGAVLTIIIGIVGVIALLAAVGTCDAATGCTPGGLIGSTALAVGGAFVIGVATVVTAVGAWLRRRSSWWIAALGFVLATVCVVLGGVLFAQAADATGASQLQSGATRVSAAAPA